jgi:hypothetical protein
VLRRVSPSRSDENKIEEKTHNNVKGNEVLRERAEPSIKSLDKINIIYINNIIMNARNFI